MLNLKSAVSINGFASGIACCLFLAGSIWGQPTAGSMLGTVTDESGAVIPGAIVDILQAGSVVQQSQSDGAGNFSVSGLASGQYSVSVKADGFQQYDSEVQSLRAGDLVKVTVTMKILAVTQQVTVTSDEPGIGLEPASNATAVVLRGTDLDVLPDDPEELKQDLQALAGPTVGGSPQTYVDGFSSSHLPPKDAIREVRINQDPFSAQYDHVGFGRVEVITKPGIGQIHGTAQFKMSDALFNSRNPYAPIKPFYRAEDFAGNVGGPLSKRASFFLNFANRWATDNEVVNASILGPSFSVTLFTQAVLMPDNETVAGGRVDYKLNEKHSVTARYEWDQSRLANAGVGGFILPSSTYSITSNIRTFQLTENATLSSTTINQARFQFVQTDLGRRANVPGPSIQVLDAFTSGGAVIGNAHSSDDLLQFQNYTTQTLGMHTLSFGGQIRREALYDNSLSNFQGTFVFAGGRAPELNALNQVVLAPNGSPATVLLSSIERYRRNAILRQAGFSPASIASLGGSASQFSIAAGQPASSVTQTDVGLFVQDSWRVTPNLTVDAGLRWEGQNDIHDSRDFAPRVGLAWMPGGKPGKTVVRAGGGIFYDRFPVQQVLLTERFNGLTQQQFVLNDPAFFPQVPSVRSLQAMGLPQMIRTLAPNLRSPYLMQLSVGVEREMPMGLLAGVSYINTRGEHLLVSQNLSARGAMPLTQVVANGVSSGNYIDYQYNSAGILNGNQIVASVRRPLRNGFTFYARYEYNHVFSNSDGVSTFPANQFNLLADYGRAATDIRHTFVLGGSVTGPFGTKLSPFLVARSGAPFNITTGHDNNGDTLFTDRPSFALASQPGAVVTPYGVFDPNPSAGAVLIPHNYGQGSGFAMLNLRISRTFGFAALEGQDKTDSAKSGPVLARIFAAPVIKYRYNFTLEVTARNLLNTTNPGMPVGNLNSPFFGRSHWLASTAGPADMAFGNNRRLQFQLRFDF